MSERGCCCWSTGMCWESGPELWKCAERVYEGMGGRRHSCEKGTMHDDMLDGLEGCTTLAGNASSFLEALIDGTNQHQYVLMIITSHIVSGTLRDTRISSLLCIYSC